MEKANKKNVKGWGVDALKDNPNYPMKKTTEGDNEGMNWVRPEKQPVNVEILHSNERPDITAVFGDTCPPRGLSGVLRRFAFKYSESSWYHWLSLLLADRIDMVEGIVEDLARGHIPNLFKEMGMKAEIKHNPKGFILKAGATGLVAYAAIRYLRKKR